MSGVRYNSDQYNYGQPRRGGKSEKGKQRERNEEEEEKMKGDVSPQRKGIVS